MTGYRRQRLHDHLIHLRVQVELARSMALPGVPEPAAFAARLGDVERALIAVLQALVHEDEDSRPALEQDRRPDKESEA
jgi:hypothetical protein